MHYSFLFFTIAEAGNNLINFTGVDPELFSGGGWGLG